MIKFCTIALLGIMALHSYWFGLDDLIIFISPVLTIVTITLFSWLQSIDETPKLKHRIRFVFFSIALMSMWSVALFLIKDFIHLQFYINPVFISLLTIIPYLLNFALLYLMYNDNWRLGNVFTKNSKLIYGINSHTMTPHFLGGKKNLKEAIESFDKLIEQIVNGDNLRDVHSVKLFSPIITDNGFNRLSVKVKEANIADNAINQILISDSGKMLAPKIKRVFYFVQFGLLRKPKKLKNILKEWKFVWKKANQPWRKIFIQRVLSS